MKNIIEAAWEDRNLLSDPSTIKAIEAVIESLDKGLIRVAEPKDDGTWQINEWIKKAVVLYFPIRKMEVYDVNPFEFYDKMDLKKDFKSQGVRVVPGAIARYGAFLAPTVILMPSFVKVMLVSSKMSLRLHIRILMG